MHLTLEEVLVMTGGKIIRQNDQDGEVKIFSVASLDEAGSSDVSFLGNEKYYQDFLKTKAGVVLIPPSVPQYPESSVLIEVENPSGAFGDIVKNFAVHQQRFLPGIHPSAFVAEGVELDPSQVSVKAGAIIEAGSSIGNGTEIGSGTVIGEAVTIGENCLLHANASVLERCVIGNHVIIQPGAVIGSDGYGYQLLNGRHETIDQVGIVLLEDHVEIGANSTVDRARFGKTIIGEGTKVDNLVQIGHNVRIGKHCLIVAQSGIAGSTHVGDYVTFAAQSASVGHLKIHDHAILTARTAALKDLEGGITYMGTPARPIHEEQKKRALVARLPKIVAQVKEMQRKLDGLG